MSAINPRYSDSDYQSYASVPSYDWIEEVCHHFIELAEDRYLEILVLYNYGPHENSTPRYSLRSNKISRSGERVASAGSSTEVNVLYSATGHSSNSDEEFVSNLVKALPVSRHALDDVISDVEKFTPEESPAEEQ